MLSGLGALGGYRDSLSGSGAAFPEQRATGLSASHPYSASGVPRCFFNLGVPLGKNRLGNAALENVQM